jgi:hypothetical protein
MSVTVYSTGNTAQTVGGGETNISSMNVAGAFQLQLDLNLLAAGDVIEIRTKKMVRAAGTTRTISLMTYADAQSTDGVIALSDVIVNPLTDTDAVLFTINQTVGTARALPFTVVNSETYPANFTSFAIDASGRVTLVPSQILIKRNQPLAAFMFMMTDSTNHAPASGLTVTATRNIDGAGFAPCANAVTGIANGWYKIDFAASDFNGTVIAVRFSAPGADDRDLTVITQP